MTTATRAPVGRPDALGQHRVTPMEAVVVRSQAAHRAYQSSQWTMNNKLHPKTFSPSSHVENHKNTAAWREALIDLAEQP